ncbi:MAG: sulfatase-like hydrolase/transferase [Rubripirellula sp.]
MTSSRLCIFLSTMLLTATMAIGKHPNILWITSEDNGPQLGCYGDEYAKTPNIDALAQRSLRYHRCWSNAPVCAPARTTIISGMYATSLGGHHMRSGVRLPATFATYPDILRKAGYYCTNNSKKDYNFATEDGGWHESGRKAHWRNRPKKDTPFFAIFNYTVSHESKIRTRPHQLKHDPAAAPVPAYHPDTAEVRHDWAQYYDKMTEMDEQVGEILAEVEADGLSESTIIFYYGDHGSGMPRSKRWPFDSGLRVPLLLHVPAKFLHLAPTDYGSGKVTDRLVSFVDLGPTAISMAGLKPPTNMQGVPFAGKYNGTAKQYLFGYRGRMDERIDMVRTCTDGRFIYMRHFYPDRPYLKHVDYMFQTPTTRVWNEMYRAGDLNEAQAKFWQDKPVEELFDLQADPDEINNLANSADYRKKTAELRNTLQNWMQETLDLGLLSEAEMHRLAGSQSPREYALTHRKLFARLSDVAFRSMDPNDGYSTQELIKLSADPYSGIRFWAVRGLATRSNRDTKRNKALMTASNDVSPSVAIAACDGLLSDESISTQRKAVERLIELADVNRQGHFAAVAALNVLDMNASLTEAEIRQISELTREAKQPPVRLGKYVGKLIDHAINAP